MNVATGGRRERLLAQVRAREALAKRKRERPLDFVRWLKPQGQVLSHTSKRLLYRGGNQFVGKTTVGAAELIWRCLGKHPRKKVRPGPIFAYVVVSTAKQGRAIQRKVRALLPDDEVDWTLTQYNAKTGFGANEPTLIFKNGSVVRFLTTQQGALVIQGDTLHYVWIDELCTPEVYRELERRVLMENGDLLLTLTPINRPAEWLSEMVAKGLVDEVHVRLTVEALTHEDGRLRTLEDGTVLDQAWIDEQRRIVPAQWAPIILDGEWRVVGLGAFFREVFDRAVHVSDVAQLDPSQGDIRWHLGVDYASAERAGLVATLVQVQHAPGDTETPGKEWVIVHDCIVLPGISTVAQLADEVVVMLGRHGLRWRDLRSAYGDNPVTGQKGDYKSNLDFARRVAHRIRIPHTSLRPPMLNAKEGRASGGSKSAGERYLNELLVSRRLVLRSAAMQIVEALETYEENNKLHPSKDKIDSLRYALKDYVFSSSNPHGGTILRISR